MMYPRAKPILHRPLSLQEANARSPTTAYPSTASPGKVQSPKDPKAQPLREHDSHSGGVFRQSRVDQSIHLMKVIHQKAGEPVRPGGHSQFDALAAMKSDMVFKVLNKKRWADFFEGLNDKSSPENGGEGSSMEWLQNASSSLAPPQGRSREEDEQEKADSLETFRIMKKRVLQLWKELNFPLSDIDFYSFNLLRTCSGTMEQFTDIARYIVVLNNYRGSTLAVLEEIRHREFAVVKLLDFMSQLRRRSTVEDYKEDLITCLQQVQITTINVIHQILNWRANFWRPLSFQ